MPAAGEAVSMRLCSNPSPRVSGSSVLFVPALLCAMPGGTDGELMPGAEGAAVALSGLGELKLF